MKQSKTSKPEPGETVKIGNDTYQVVAVVDYSALKRASKKGTWVFLKNKDGHEIGVEKWTTLS